MPSKRRWALNPRKWFGAISKATQERNKNIQINNTVVQLPPTKITRTIPSAFTVPRLLISKNKTKIIPTSSINTNNYYRNSMNNLAGSTQFQLPPFGVRREKTSVLLSSTTVNRQNTCIEPSIRKNSQFKAALTPDTTQWNTETIVCDKSKPPISQYGNNLIQNSSEKQSELYLSEECLVNYPHDLAKNFIEKSPSPARSHSISSIEDIDEHDESSSSGVFTDERADFTDHQRSASKDTLSTGELLSIGSIGDSQTSLNHCQSPPITSPYRLSVSRFEATNNKSSQLQRQTPILRTDRARSAENILKNNRTPTPVQTKSRQSSAAIVKKIEKRIPINQSPSSTLEKASFVRIANATYRLTMDKDDHLYRRHRRNSVIQYSNNDDSLRPANDEESYATLPRTSSTEQLNNNIQNDLRAIIDDYLRPVVASINKRTDQSTKMYHGSKRSPKTNNEHPQIDIEDITDRLLSSIDCSTYAQYQRCY